MVLSGWCTAPEGARPKCEGCRVEGCEHECHETRLVERDSGVGRVESDVNEGRFRANGSRPSDRIHLLEKGGGW